LGSTTASSLQKGGTEQESLKNIGGGMDCLFCKIAAGEIPAQKLYEDDEIMAFLDIFPATAGHTLVMPKAHYADLPETPDGLLEKMIRAVRKLSPAILEGLGSQAFNLVVNNGKLAGQVVPHVHFHIMPRYPDDTIKVNIPQQPYPEGEIELVKQKILQALEK